MKTEKAESPEAPRATPIRDAILAAIRAKGLTTYRLAKMSGIDRNPINRFVKGDRGLSLATAEALVVALGIKIIAPDTEDGRSIESAPPD